MYHGPAGGLRAALCAAAWAWQRSQRQTRRWESGRGRARRRSPVWPQAAHQPRLLVAGVVMGWRPTAHWCTSHNIYYDKSYSS